MWKDHTYRISRAEIWGKSFNFRKTNYYKKLLFGQSLLFWSSVYNYRKKVDIFSKEVPHIPESFAQSMAYLSS